MPAAAVPAPQPAHSPFGGSVAARVLRCPASVGLVAKVPAYLRKSSIYAERGTALPFRDGPSHRARAVPRQPRRRDDRRLHDHARRRRECSAAGSRLCGGAARCPVRNTTSNSASSFPTIAGAFGRRPARPHRRHRACRRLQVRRRRARPGAHPDGDEDVINAQLLFYAAAARHSLPEFFAGVDDIVLTIVQPQSIEEDAEMVSSVTVTHGELDEFIALYRAACAEALAPAPRLERGAHCRFCAARPICPEHTKPLLDLAQFDSADAFALRRRVRRAAGEGSLPAAARRRLEPRRRDQGPAHGAARSGETGAGKRRRRARLRALGRPRRAPLAR